MSISRILCLSVVIPIAVAAAPAASQTATIGQGTLKGATEDGAEVFKNIPFAAPPVGPLRWKPPQPAAGWAGVRDATAFGPACPQPRMTGFGRSAIGVEMGDEGPYTTSEDCLNLNVRRPAGTAAGAKLPVMVWMYGGGFSFGRNSQKTYTGTALVKRGVILVTPNYRLGALGFMAHPDLTAEDPHHSSGNYGALDTVAALRWVKANIAAFGGDPDNVTIFGESAGGGMVGYLAGSPLTRGLFQRIISESGVFFGPPDRGGGPGGGASDSQLAYAEQGGVDYLKRSGATSIAAARALPAERILAAGAMGPGQPPIFFRPNVDGWFLPKLSYDLLRAGDYDKRPVLVGSNDDEGALGLPNGITLAQYRAITRQNWGADADRLMAAYPATTDAEATHAARNMQRDATFGWSAWTWGRFQRGASVYVYNFDHRPPFPKEAAFADFGAPHAAELAYVFGNFSAPEMTWTTADHELSDQIVGYWTNFARTGDPNGAGLPRWAPFRPATQQSIHFGQTATTMGPVNSLPGLTVIDGVLQGRRSAK